MEVNDLRRISHRIRHLRQKKGLTAKQVAREVEVPVSTYQSWEYGTAIRGEPYVKLAKMLGCTVEFLLFGADDKQKVLLHQIRIVERELQKLQEQVSMTVFR